MIPLVCALEWSDSPCFFLSLWRSLEIVVKNSTTSSLCTMRFVPHQQFCYERFEDRARTKYSCGDGMQINRHTACKQSLLVNLPKNRPPTTVSFGARIAARGLVCVSLRPDLRRQCPLQRGVWVRSVMLQNVMHFGLRLSREGCRSSW